MSEPEAMLGPLARDSWRAAGWRAADAVGGTEGANFHATNSEKHTKKVRINVSFNRSPPQQKHENDRPNNGLRRNIPDFDFKK